jgi:hypothetical protein
VTCSVTRPYRGSQIPGQGTHNHDPGGGRVVIGAEPLGGQGRGTADEGDALRARLARLGVSWLEVSVMSASGGDGDGDSDSGGEGGDTSRSIGA